MDKVFDKSKFLKIHQMVGYKFFSANIYVLLSNLFALCLGLVHAGNMNLHGMEDPVSKFEAVKQLVDSFSFTFYILVFSNLYTNLVQPVINYGTTGKPTERDISFGLSFLSTCVFYIGSFAPFNISIITIVTISVVILVAGEVALYYFGYVVPAKNNSFSLIANYFSVLMVGVYPLSIATF